MGIDLTSRVAIVTGAGAGLGAAHARALADYGAAVMVSDMNAAAAQTVCDEIVAAGGDAVAASVDVADWDAVQAMRDAAMDRWGRIDILINNAGLLRDRSFAKLDLDNFRKVVDVHLMGSVHCTKAVWDVMREQNYGRIVFTTSSSGLYGNFGQANYSAAKMGLVGLMQTLAIEGARYGIKVNSLAPSAATGMTNELYTAEMLAGLGAELVSPGVVMLSSEEAPTRMVLLAGAGSFEQAHVTMTRGVYLGDVDRAADVLLDRVAEVGCREGEMIPEDGPQQYVFEVERRLQAMADTQA